MLCLLITTIPRRAEACARLFAAISNQTRKPDAVLLILDGYGATPRPGDIPGIEIHEHRTEKPQGPGNRWRVAKQLDPDTTLVVIDDDINISRVPNFVQTMAAAVTPGYAAAASGIGLARQPAHWGDNYPKPLICGNAGTSALRVGDLDGLEEMAEKVKTVCGFDPLGDCGDDEALVSANLWRRDIKIRHVKIDNLRVVESAQADSQTIRRHRRFKTMDHQRMAIRKVTGWPWPAIR